MLASNDSLGEFLVNIDGTAQLPEPTKMGVDEKSLEPTRVKLIKSSRLDDNNITLRCFTGDKIEVKILVPVCNKQRESAIVKATEMVNLNIKKTLILRNRNSMLKSKNRPFNFSKTSMILRRFSC